MARVVFALLVLACFVAFLVTQHLKHTPTVVQNFKRTPIFSPTPTGHIKQERISFRIGRADSVSVTIINADGTTVATLIKDQPIAAYKQLSLLWNGNRGSSIPKSISTTTGLLVHADDHGPPAPSGKYRVEVHLLHENRFVKSTWSFKLERNPHRHAQAR
jgi:hypothetical protein